MLKSKITGVGSYIPNRQVKNQDLEKIMDTSNEWIVQRTGIESRYWVDENTATSDLALEASKEAIKNAGLNVSDIDMVIFATLSPDHDFPGSGCFLQAKLGLPAGVPALDIRQQCSGFLYGMSIADKFIQSGSHKNILMIGAEVHSKGLDKTPRGRDVSVLFGDGAGACVISATNVQDPKKDAHIIHTALHADGSFAKELWLEAPGSAVGGERISSAMIDNCAHFPSMNGKVVFVHAVKRMCETIGETLNHSKYKPEDVDLYLFHQANLRINSKVAETLQIPESKVFNTIQRFGNTTAATIPLGMHEAIKAGVLKPGMLVASAVFGSGFTWASALWRH
jgi:3-oxoacyl-[acyl-carrier-protein] synthase III